MATVVIEIKQIKENQDEGVNILIKKLLAIFLNTHTKVIQLTPPTVRTLFLFFCFRHLGEAFPALIQLRRHQITLGVIKNTAHLQIRTSHSIDAISASMCSVLDFIVFFFSVLLL